jgi:hypothetical protein
MVHTIEVIAPHFRVKLFTQNRNIKFMMQNVNPELHVLSFTKVSSSPFTDLFGKNATTINMPRDASGRLEIAVNFRPPAGKGGRQALWDYLSYKLVITHKQISLSALRQDTYTWNLADIETREFDITRHVSSRMIVQLDAPLSFEKNENSLTIPVRAAYATKPTDMLPAGAVISVFMAPTQTYLEAGAYIAGEFYQKCSECIPELTYKLP